MGLWADLIGTVKGYIILGVGGVRLKNSSGALSIRNTADSADAQVVASSLKADAWYNSDGTENYKCRAWVNFNGTGTVAIRASGNVSSITDNGTGDYTINFTNAMPDANYAVSAIAASSTAGNNLCYRVGTGGSGTGLTTTTARLVFATGGGIVQDCEIVCVSFFR